MPDATPTAVLISDILRDPALQVRARIEPKTVQLYAAALRNGAEFPPVELAETPEGQLLLVDGWHRVAAHEMNGAATITATVAEMTREDAQWRAATANLARGLPIKPREYRAVFRAYMETRQYRKGKAGGAVKSLREIAAEVGAHISHVTIQNWMRRDFPKIERAHYRRGIGANPEAEGHPPQPPLVSESPAARAEQALSTVVLLAREIPDATERARLANLAREIAAQIEAAEPWTQARAGFAAESLAEGQAGESTF